MFKGSSVCSQKQLLINDNNNCDYECYYQGGGTVIRQCGDDLIEHAYFRNGIPAVLSKKYGSGQIVLTSVHPEHPNSRCDDLFKRILNTNDVNSYANTDNN